MEIMKSDVSKCMIFLSLMSFGEAILPFPYSKTSDANRNNLGDILSSKIEPSISNSGSSGTHECLYIYPNLPACDFERIGDSEEDITHSTRDYREIKGPAENVRTEPFSRNKRNVQDEGKLEPKESSSRHVIVYTIEGCLPSSRNEGTTIKDENLHNLRNRLPFSMPSCQDGNSLDKIVEVRKLYPFTVKGLKKAPIVFPEFNFDRWRRMIKRLRDRASSTTNIENHETLNEEEPMTDNQLRNNLLNKLAITKAMMPKVNTANIKVSKGSSPNEFISSNSQTSAETVNKEQQGFKENTSIGFASQERMNTNMIYSNKQVENKGKMEKSRIEDTGGKKLELSNSKKKISNNPKTKIMDEDEQRKRFSANIQKSEDSKSGDENGTSRAIPEIPRVSSRVRKPQISMETNQNVYRGPITFDDTSNGLRIAGNSNNLVNLARSVSSVPKSPSSTMENNEFTYSKTNEFEGDHVTLGGFNDLQTSSKIIQRSSRRKREIQSASTHPRQRIHNESKEYGIPGKSLVPGSRKPRETLNSGSNRLDVPSKWHKLTSSKGSSFPENKQHLANKYKNIVENKNIKTSLRVKTKSETRHSIFDRIGIARMSKVIMKQIPLTKKYGQFLKVTSKYDGRSRRYE